MPLSPLEVVFDTVTDGMVTIDESGIIMSFNRAAERMFGYPEGEVLGSDIKSLMPERYREEHDRAVRRYLETGEARIIGTGRNVRGLRKDGTDFPMRLTLGVVAGESGQRFLGVIRDLSDQEAHRRDADDQAARMRAIVDTALDGIITIDEHGRIETFNPAAERIFGRTAHEVIDKNVRVLMPPPYRDAHDGYLKGYLESNFPRVIGIGREVRGLRSDGRTFPMELAISEMTVGGKRMFTGIVRDITDRRRAEEAMRSERRAAEHANAMKTAFLANMSHELRTPLFSILGLSEALLEGTYEGAPDKRKGALSTILGSGTHLLALIDDVLDLSRVEAGQIRLTETDVDLSALVRECLEMVSECVGNKDVRLRSDFLDTPSLHVRGDFTRLRQILINLLDNAFKFTPEGGEVGVSVAPSEDERHVLLCVWDTGVGIPENDRERVFEPFVRLRQPDPGAAEGVGLGLSLVKQLVELHHGQVSLESLADQGSRFTVTLPRLDANTVRGEEQSQDRADPSGTVKRRQRVLLVEDNAINAEVLGDYLSAKGYEVVLAQDGLSAVDAAVQGGMDAILMDVQLPGIDGLEAIRRIRAHEAGASCPIIALTAQAMPEDRDACLAAGATDYMAKPVSLRELERRIADLVEAGDRRVAELVHTP